MNRLKAFLIVVGVVVVSISLPHAAHAKQYTKEQFIEMGGQSMSGTVLKVGVYNFIIQTQDGAEVNIHTDYKKIQFVPEDERLMVGDQISFIYLASESASGSIDKRLAYYIEFTEKIPRKFLTDEMTCVVSMSGMSAKACYLPEHGKFISFEGHWPNDLNRRSIGSKIKIRLKAIPANVGNGYIYKVKDAKDIDSVNK